MKLHNFLLIGLLLVFGCNSGGTAEQENALRAENEKLKKESSLKDSSIRDFIGSFNQIVDNLHSISETERGIAITVRKSKKLKPDDKTKIAEGVKMINDLIEENKRITESMRKNFSTSWLNFKECDTLLLNLNHQVEEKNNEINSMKQRLGEADIAFNTFDDLLNKLTDVNLGMDRRVQNMQDTIEKLEKQVNTAWYILGTSKELKDAGVISKSGLGRAENPLKNFNTAKFIRIDLRETRRITIWSTNFRVITNHAPNSYKMERNTLFITNPGEFWKLTKYLIVIKE